MMNRSEMKKAMEQANTIDDLKKVFHGLLKEVHPDNGGNDEDTVFLFSLYDVIEQEIKNRKPEQKQKSETKTGNCESMKDFLSRDGMEQMIIIEKMIRHVISWLHAWMPNRKMIACNGINSTGFHGLSYGDWALKDMQTAVNESWCKLFDFASDEIPFSIALFKACKSALHNLYNHEKKHDNVLKLANKSECEKYDYQYGTEITDLNAYESKQDESCNVEGTAILMETLRTACKDRIDKMIISGRLNGLNNVEIAEKLNISKQAVGKRLKAIEKRYHEKGINIPMIAEKPETMEITGTVNHENVIRWNTGSIEDYAKQGVKGNNRRYTGYKLNGFYIVHSSRLATM